MKKTLYKGKYLTLNLDDDYETISENFERIAILPYNSETGKYLIRKELCPPWSKEKLIYTCITGLRDKENEPIQETASRELFEEAGYSINSNNIRFLGKCYISKASDSMIYLFTCDLSQIKKQKNPTDGTYSETVSKNAWASKAFIIQYINDPLVHIMLNRVIQ